MAEAGFAKTPWYVGGNGRDVLWFDPALDRCKVIATVAGYVQSDGSVFDEARTARLIAAAPDLYEAGLAALEAHESVSGKASHKPFERLRAALLKATGETK